MTHPTRLPYTPFMELPTALIYDPICLEHDTGGAHVERPEGLTAIREALASYGLAGDGDYMQPPDATIAQLERVHDGDYIRLVQSIAQRIAEQHGGAITLSSELGQGSRFTVTLPLFSPLPLA